MDNQRRQVCRMHFYALCALSRYCSSVVCQAASGRSEMTVRYEQMLIPRSAREAITQPR